MELRLQTHKKEEFRDITQHIKKEVKIKNGFCIVYCPHTTAGITINEGADPDVRSDILNALDKITPEIHYAHMEGNSPAHIKASLMGSSATILIKDGQLRLGRWQKIFFVEFDGPRNRWIKVEFF
ncbi:MAG: secondary thiamine-phosphate synthase enzyme YjbQ [Nanoarchaeota archaeon]|nr:secondary thiamine-phosphate synthase enzyme YjbQ [Nanoarchaeota archaeon]